MDSFQLSLFSGDVPDENIKKNDNPSSGNKSNEKKIESKPETNLTKEDQEISRIYNSFKCEFNPSEETKSDFIQKLYNIANNCKKCKLNEQRKKLVFSDGHFTAPILIVGEGPGENEDNTGLPFVGKAGQLLDKILLSAGIERKKDVYIINAVKCRPPQNRTPSQEELDACHTYLEKQIEVSSAKIILLSGASAMKAVLKSNLSITKMRGEWIEWNDRFVMPIFHPSYLLRNPSKDVGSPKWLMWQDIKKVKQKYEELRGN